MKPILFNTEIVQAILEGRKTVTRRVIKDKDIINSWDCENDGTPIAYIDQATGDSYAPTISCPYQPGDIMWVRETWTYVPDGSYVYKASVECPDAWRGTWHPSIQMPKEAARLFLRVVAVWVERLKDITPEQIDAEGCKEWTYSAMTGEPLPSGPSWFRIAWDRTIKPSDLPAYGWEANPWVWVIKFERISRPPEVSP